MRKIDLQESFVMNSIGYQYCAGTIKIHRLFVISTVRTFLHLLPSNSISLHHSQRPPHIPILNSPTSHYSVSNAFLERHPSSVFHPVTMETAYTTRNPR